MSDNRTIKGMLRQKIYFASNLIFWVGMGWGIGQLAQNTPKIPKITLKLTWGGQKFVPGTLRWYLAMYPVL